MPKEVLWTHTPFSSVRQKRTYAWSASCTVTTAASSVAKPRVNGLARRLSEGIGQTLAMQAFAGVDALAAVAGMGPVGEFRLVPDPSTFVVLPYVPHSAMMLCDMLTLERQPWEACPRTFLKRMVASAAQMGIVMQAAVEHEFYLARATPSG